MHVPFWARLLCPQPRYLVSFLSYRFPRKPFRKVKSSKLAACSYPATAPGGEGTPYPRVLLAAWLGKPGTSGAATFPSCGCFVPVLLYPSWCCVALDEMAGFLWCLPELLFELLEELYDYIAWKSLPVLLSPHAEVFLACQYSSIKYFQLSMLLTSIYSSGVKARVQHKWMSCLCSGCTAFTAGCREKTWDLITILQPSGRPCWNSVRNPCKRDADRAVATADVYSSWCGFTICTYFFPPNVWGKQR